MTRQEEIRKEIEKLQAELKSLKLPRFEAGTLVKFRDYSASDDSPMDKSGKVFKHGRKWIEIKVDGQKGSAWAKANPLGAMSISADLPHQPNSLGHEGINDVQTRQNGGKLQESPVATQVTTTKKERKVKGKKHEPVEMQKTA